VEWETTGLCGGVSSGPAMGRKWRPIDGGFPSWQAGAVRVITLALPGLRLVPNRALSMLFYTATARPGVAGICSVHEDASMSGARVREKFHRGEVRQG
jgi:hypothetical protein